MKYEEKKDLLQQALNKTFEEKEIIINSISDKTVTFTIDKIEKMATYEINESNSEVVLTIEEEKIVEENGFEGTVFQDNNFDKKSEEINDSEEECGHFEDNNENSEESCNDPEEECGHFEDNNENSEESCNDPEEMRTLESDENDCDEDEKECCKFMIDDQEYSANEIFEKYCVDMKKAQQNYADLKKSYDKLMVDFNNCETKLRKFETQELVNEVSQILKKVDFTEDETKSFIERCEKREFNSIQEATKEIAYIAFMNNEKINQNNEVEFSARVDFTMKPQAKNTDKKIFNNCFDMLQNYINE